jgi:AbrB family looped-hinge helix DNA binding protein
MGAKGQVVIPKEIRDRHGLGPGTPVSFEEGHDGIVLRPGAAARPLRGRFAGSGMAGRLLEDRRAEPR